MSSISSQLWVATLKTSHVLLGAYPPYCSVLPPHTRNSDSMKADTWPHLPGEVVTRRARDVAHLWRGIVAMLAKICGCSHTSVSLTTVTPSCVCWSAVRSSPPEMMDTYLATAPHSLHTDT